MPNVRKRRKRPLSKSSFVFEDSKFPATPDDIILLYTCGYDLPSAAESLTAYATLATTTLATAGYVFEQSFDAWSEDCERPLEVYEAWRLLNLSNSLESIKELRLQIMNEEKLAGHPVDGSENVLSLIEVEKKLVGEIHGLGERIKARKAEDMASLGVEVSQSLRNGNLANSEKADKDGRTAWREYLDSIVREHPDWSDRSMAAYAFRKHPIELPSRNEDTIRDYVGQVRRSKITSPF
jgi:hypothetical protein